MGLDSWQNLSKQKKGKEKLMTFFKVLEKSGKSYLVLQSSRLDLFLFVILIILLL